MYHERVYSWITFWNPLTLILWTVISIGESCQLLVGCPFWTYHTLHLEFQKKPRRGLPHRLGKRLVYFLKVIIETMFVYHFTDADLAFEILPKRRGEKENGSCFRYRGLRYHCFPAWLFGNMFHTRQMFLYTFVSKQYCKFYRHLLIYVP